MNLKYKYKNAQKWPQLSEVKSIGFEWSEWPVPGSYNPAENKELFY